MPHKGVPPGTQCAWLGNASTHMAELKGTVALAVCLGVSFAHCPEDLNIVSYSPLYL